MAPWSAVVSLVLWLLAFVLVAAGVLAFAGYRYDARTRRRLAPVVTPVERRIAEAAATRRRRRRLDAAMRSARPPAPAGDRR